MTRQRLEPRRQSETVELEWLGRPFQISVGFHRDGRPLEVFATGAKEGSDTAHLLADACVLLSIALQHGATAKELAHSLGTIPVPNPEDPDTPLSRPASVAGALVAAILTARPQTLDFPVPAS